MASMGSASGFVQHMGNHFVKVYYDLLHIAPEILSGLYHDTCSTVSRPEEDGTSTVTTTTKAIHAKLLAFNHGINYSKAAEIKSVDILESLNNGITILVTGCITRKDNTVKNFTQSFFLAPQGEDSFCVLNDIFRYIDNVTEDPVVPTATSHEPRVESEAEYVYVDERHDSWVVV